MSAKTSAMPSSAHYLKRWPRSIGVTACGRPPRTSLPDMSRTRFLARCLRPATLSALLLPGLCAAVTLEPPKFRWGDAWTWTIATTTRGVVKPPERVMFSTLWTTSATEFLTGAAAPGRKASETAWTLREKIAINACLPFVGYTFFSLDDRFCEGTTEPGRQFDVPMPFGRRMTRFEGMAMLETKVGKVEAARFLIIDTFVPHAGEKPALAREARSELWFAPSLRGVVKYHRQAFDERGALLDDVLMTLEAVALQP